VADEFFFTKDGKQYGPVSAVQLKQLADSGRLKPTDKVKKGGMANWVNASAVKGLFEVAAAPPPIPSAVPAPPPPAPVHPPATPVEEITEAILVEEDEQPPDQAFAVGSPPARLDKKSRARADIQDALLRLALDPVGRLPEAYDRLGRTPALLTGLACSLVFVLCLVLFVYFLPNILAGWVGRGDTMPGPSPYSRSAPTPKVEAKVLFKIALLGVVIPAGLVLGSLVSRKLFRGTGSPESDVFLAGVSLVPGALLFLVSLLGITLAEANQAMILFVICCSILIQYSGCTRLHKMSEGAGTLAVPFMNFLAFLLVDVMARWVVF
jgi:hypothetical protein